MSDTWLRWLGSCDRSISVTQKVNIKQKNVMDLFPNEQNFDLDESRQKFHHSLKGHHKISNIPKFRFEML
jgi:hypothetical protein